MNLARLRGGLAVALFGLLSVLGPAAAAEPAPLARDARLTGDGSRTRLVFDLDRSVPIRAFTLADPYRVIIDLPEVNFQLPAGRGSQGRGLVSAFRFGLFAPGKSRIVVDTTGPVAIDKAILLDAVEDQPARLLIDLVKTDRASFMRALALRSDDKRPSAPNAAAQAAASDPRPVVVIDPGHGGVDNGATSSGGIYEKDIVLAFASRLREKLQDGGRYRVVLTREDDSFVALADRVEVARTATASLFVSIHADTLTDPFGVRGATVYTLSETASDEEAARFADKENRADIIAGVDLSEEPEEVAGILFDLARRETKTFALHFARTLVGELKTSLRLNKNPVRSAGFRVLKAPDVPSVLLELGYMSNPDDLKLMTSEPWREKATDSLSAAIDSFFAMRLAGSPARRLN